MTLAELEMRKALGLSEARQSYPSEKPTSVKVTLSVRHPDGGKPFRFEHQSSTISSTMAVISAERAARAEGLRVHALLSVE